VNSRNRWPVIVGFRTPAFAQKLDGNGRCHDAAGRFAKMDVCERDHRAHTGPVAAVYKLDAKGRMAKKAMCAGMKTP